MVSKPTKSVRKKPKQEENAVKFEKEKVVMFFMAFGIMSVFAAFYFFLVEYVYMPKTLSFFVLSLLFFFLALMYNVAEK
jgi:vacuolar-type H+-ATPase subunit I/STV1